MSKSSEYATLVLDTGYLTQASGSITSLQTFNVNLKQLLGDMYDEYDTFAICLNSCALYSQISTYNTGDPEVVSLGSSTPVRVGMSGLNWLSSTMNGNKSTLLFFPNAFAIGGGISANDGGYGQAFFNNPKYIMFSKPAEPNVTLTVALYVMRKNLPMRAANSAGEIRLEINYNFSIFGIIQEVEN